MGSYGIGPARIVAAAIEQFADEQGISWPRALAPFDVELVTLGKPGEEAREVSDRLYDELREPAWTCSTTTATPSPGEKFADAELLGCPLRADDRQEERRGRRDRGAGPPRPGEALPAARRRGRGGRGAVADPPLTFRRLLGLDRSGGPPPRDAARASRCNPWTIPNAIGFVRLALRAASSWRSA